LTAATATERALAELLVPPRPRLSSEIHLFAQRVEILSFSNPGAGSPRSGRHFWHRSRLPRPLLLHFFSGSISIASGGGAIRPPAYFVDIVVSAGINCADADVILVHASFTASRTVTGENLPCNPVSCAVSTARLTNGLLTSLEKRIYSSPGSLTAVSPRTAELLGKYFHRRGRSRHPHGVDALQFFPPARLARANARVPVALSRQRNLFSSSLEMTGITRAFRLFSKRLPRYQTCPQSLLIVGNDAIAPRLV